MKHGSSQPRNMQIEKKPKAKHGPNIDPKLKSAIYWVKGINRKGGEGMGKNIKMGQNIHGGGCDQMRQGTKRKPIPPYTNVFQNKMQQKQMSNANGTTSKSLNRVHIWVGGDAVRGN